MIKQNNLMIFNDIFHITLRFITYTRQYKTTLISLFPVLLANKNTENVLLTSP